MNNILHMRDPTDNVACFRDEFECTERQFYVCSCGNMQYNLINSIKKYCTLNENAQKYYPSL